MIVRPGRDPRAVLHRAPGGTRSARDRSAVVIGGGIAGLSAATVLAERGVHVRILEREDTWGGRARSWDLPDGRSMSRGFHAFFRQYYTLRSLLSRADPQLSGLVDIGDYPLQMADGPRDSFRGVPRTPPWSVAAFALRSRSFPLAQLARVDIPAAIGLLRAEFPGTFSAFDGVSAQEFLDRLNFPSDARHLALEVFARSFFADPSEFSAGELVGMFHTYFMGSAEGLIFDVPTDTYSATLWAPMVDMLAAHGAQADTGVSALAIDGSGEQMLVDTTAGEVTADALVLAADPRTSRGLIAGATGTRGASAKIHGASDGHAGGDSWSAFADRIAAQRNAPPFAVWRMWLDREISPDAPAFLGTSGYGPLDNVTVLNRFEQTAARWTREHGGSVVELHAYAISADAVRDDADHAGLRRELLSQLHRLAPELAGAGILLEEWLVQDDCALIGTDPWASRPTVATPDPRIVLAGDWLRTDEPVALMERAALTGVHAANRLLEGWGVAGEDWWSVPMRGVLRRG